MRILPVLLLPLMLAGCAGMDVFAPAPSFSAPGPCGALARQRLDDARMHDLAEGYEKAIFDYSYQDCLRREAAR